MVFISQIILLTIDYCEYETVVDLELRKEENILHIPAITLCIDRKNEIFRVNRKISNKRQIGEYFREIFCQIK
jgi:hypothetical protein